MPSLNKVIIIGHLGRDPELKDVGSTTVCNFSLASTEKWKDKDGNKQERTEWHNVTLWGKQGEVVQKYCKKGDALYVEGRLQTDKYDKDGQTHYATKIIGERFQFMGKAKGNSQDAEIHSDGAGDGVPF